MKKIPLRELASLVKGDLEDSAGEVIVECVSSIEKAEQGSLTFATDKKSAVKAENSQASAVIIPQEIESFSKPFIRVKDPRLALTEILKVFDLTYKTQTGISDKSCLGENITLEGDNITIYPFVFIGSNVRIGDRTTIYPHVYIANDVVIGEGTIIYPSVTIKDRVRIGRNVILHSGCVVGSDGFGYAKAGAVQKKIPQIGTVVLEDDVELGANVTIDRATLEETRIGRGTKIDNLVQIAHNVTIGEDVIFSGQSGVAGSTNIGDRVTIAAQAGITGHINVGSDTIIAGRGGVTHDLPPRSFVSGFPARPHREELRIQGVIPRLPEIFKLFSMLKKKLNIE